MLGCEGSPVFKYGEGLQGLSQYAGEFEVNRIAPKIARMGRVNTLKTPPAESFAANGNLSWNVAYDSQVLKTVPFAANYSECHNLCTSFSSRSP
jgi:hypothetical protein